ncbi:fimbrial biogenesis outer membrane usher protein [Alsobacter metallidurans]|uniref:Fimbrial biogenesis outer membrane usher protein n=1 Tax=Alsobacter metallidurans TaxID=340221 RepID=A0A917MH23_9HYPH|nr:fimbria/pilus outer membrane usher protein [Alsobacter metallidurans]GGH12435.1 fimbrial biogenesis outer membrane usher protein [Alsobacter metallidurans]
MSGSTRTVKAGVVLLLIVGPLFESRASLAGPEERDLHLEVLINERRDATIGAFHQTADGRLTAKRAELRSIGIIPPGRGQDDESVDLAALPGVTAVYDEPKQTIAFKVSDPTRLAPTVVDAATADGVAPFEPPQSGWGAAVNYLVFGSAQQTSWGARPNFGGGSINFDARAFTPYGVLEQSAILGTTTMRQADAVRLDTRFTYTDAERMLTAQAGDVLTAGPSWARPLRLGGVSLRKDYALRQDIVTGALPVLNGTAAAPSTVDVFVNGVKTYSRDVPAGPFSLANVPGVSGAGAAQVVLRDATGREIRTSLPFFTSSRLLKEGVFDYAGALGFARYGYATAGTTYGKDPLGVAAARYGATDWLTLETYNEGGAGLGNVGVGGYANVFDLGVLSLAARASRLAGARGYQGYASFETRLGPFSINGAVQQSFGDFRDLADVTARLYRPGKVRSVEFYDTVDPSFGYTAPNTPLRSAQRLSVSTAGPWTGSSIGVSAVRQTYDGRASSSILSAQVNQQFGPDWSLFASSFVDFGKSRTMGVFAGLSVVLGPTDMVTAGGSVVNGAAQANIQAQRQIGSENGSYGARVNLAQGQSSAPGYGAGLGYQSEYGRAAVNGDHQRGSSNLNAEWEGAIVAMPQGVAATRRIEDSFALVKAGAPGVEISHEGRAVGRTDRWGNVVVPGLFANAPNAIGVNPETLPASTSLAETSARVTPAYRSGVVVNLQPTSEANVAMVTLKDEAGRILEPGSVGALEDGQPFVVGTEGRAYMRGLQASNLAVVDLGGKSCRASFAYQPQPDRMVQIGPVTCR